MNTLQVENELWDIQQVNAFRKNVLLTKSTRYNMLGNSMAITELIVAKNPVRDTNFSTCHPRPVLIDWQDVVFHFSLDYHLFFSPLLELFILVDLSLWTGSYRLCGPLKQTDCISISTLCSCIFFIFQLTFARMMLFRSYSLEIKKVYFCILASHI